MYKMAWWRNKQGTECQRGMLCSTYARLLQTPPIPSAGWEVLTAQHYGSGGYTISSRIFYFSELCHLILSLSPLPPSTPAAAFPRESSIRGGGVVQCPGSGRMVVAVIGLPKYSYPG